MGKAKNWASPNGGNKKMNTQMGKINDKKNKLLIKKYN